jgi:nucleotidyltransferase-like protein
MPEISWRGAEVRFLDYDQVMRDIRKAVADAKARLPEIDRVFLFGSLVQGTWTAHSDADMIVVVRKALSDFSSRRPYYIFAPGTATDTFIYSETEFAQLSSDPSSFLGQNLQSALEL